MLGDTRDVEEQSSANIVEAFPFASNGESLARKAAADKVVTWYVSSGNSGNVSSINLASEVFIVSVASVLIPLV
jgi:hypothetical protein